MFMVSLLAMLLCIPCFISKFESNLDYWRRKYILSGEAGVSYECIPSFPLSLLQLYHFVSFLSCINQTLSYPSFISYMADTRISHFPLQGRKNYLYISFPTYFFFFSVLTVELLLWLPSHLKFATQSWSWKWSPTFKTPSMNSLLLKDPGQKVRWASPKFTADKSCIFWAWAPH